MKYEILNSYELDIKQDIPAEMIQLKRESESLNKTNTVLKVAVIGVVLGFIATIVVNKTKLSRTDNE